MARVIVRHRGYGCETGCCGHAVEIDGREVEFDFSHPYTQTPADVREYIREVVTKTVGAAHVKDIDFDHCLVVDGNYC